MKPSIILITLLVIIPYSLQAQKNVIKTNILSPLFKTGSFFYERVISEKIALQLGFYYTNFNYNSDIFFDPESEKVVYNGFGITPELKIYPNANAGNGFYVAPFLRYQNLDLDSEYYSSSRGNIKDEATLTTFGGGLIVGKQWLIKNTISIEIFTGPCFNVGEVKLKATANSSEPKDPFDNLFFNSFGLRTGINLGIAF